MLATPANRKQTLVGEASTRSSLGNAISGKLLLNFVR